MKYWDQISNTSHIFALITNVIMKLFTKLLFPLICLCFACKPTAHKPLMDCKEWKTGTYELNDQIENVTYKIIRTLGTQREINLSTAEEIIYDINWINNCSYKLSFREGPDWAKPMWENKFLTVVITGGNKDVYSFHAQMSDSDIIIANEMIIK